MPDDVAPASSTAGAALAAGTPLTAETAPAAGAAPAASDTLWDDWAEGAKVPSASAEGKRAEGAPPRLPTMPELHVDGFDGPMDLLLDLAERQRIDLGRISMLALAEHFAATMSRLLPHVPLERCADWLVLAAHLLLLRSRLLFPVTSEGARQAERDASREVERLEELRFLRAAASWLQARPQLGHDVFARPACGPDPRAASYMALMEACLALLEREEEAAANTVENQAAVYRAAGAVLFCIPDALARIRAVLAELSELAPFRAFLPQVARDGPGRELRARSALCCTFMRCLELAREGAACMAQELAFDTISVAPVPSSSRSYEGCSSEVEG